ncbi:flavin reductase family protein [Actinoallomurus vinaceus]|uniref:Flavin reductase family protein n=1 Tax=Actinoallomurus vinaceus TaxID=1080074 RepID=A0ABP8U7I2_9ACTN
MQSFPATDAHAFRRVLGHFCTGVTVITTSLHGDPAGFTCQAFSTLSLDPPLVLFCVSTASTTWPKIRDAGFFCVNVLAAGQEDLGRRFARRGCRRFDGMVNAESPGGAPMISGAAAWIDCTLEDRHEAGDHNIVIGKARHLSTDTAKEPLLFFRGEWATLGPLSGRAAGR